MSECSTDPTFVFFRNNDELCIAFHNTILTIVLNQYVFNQYIVDKL